MLLRYAVLARLYDINHPQRSVLIPRKGTRTFVRRRFVAVPMATWHSYGNVALRMRKFWLPRSITRVTIWSSTATT